jgi:hypothetical protein
MGVVVSIRRTKAFLRDGVWRCCEQELESRLNESTEAWILDTGGPALNSPDPELEVAREMARRHGGRIVLRVPAPARQAARDYFSKRQYKLAFQ